MRSISLLQFLEHHRTVKDSKGNEETTVTQQIGEQKYSVTTIVGSNGEIQKNETFVNIDEGKTFCLLV